MDNISHTLIGVLVGESAHRAVPARASDMPARIRRNLGIGLMIAGSNLPDADFIYSALTGSKLDYLLHHRGHTHTIVAALVTSLAMMAFVSAWVRSRRIQWSGRDVRYLLAMALLGPLLHLCLDFTNSYGVHPFWPVRNDWFYGDAVFIVEPLLWAAGTPLLFTLQGYAARALVALALIAGVVLSFTVGIVPPILAGVLVAFIAVLAVIGVYARAGTALASGIAAWLGVTLVFFVSGAAARTAMEELLAAEYPTARNLDLVLTPMPVNPFCREVLAVQEDGDRYVVRKAMLASWPGFMTAQACPQRVLGEESTAPLSPATAPSSAVVTWNGDFSLGKSAFVELARDYCAVSALMQFARVPFAMRQEGYWIFGDMRYDREPGLGMAEIEVGLDKDECPSLIPPWTPPRADLLIVKPKAGL